jgi:uncharacterized membrane protein YjjB (DUF3815 family)
MKRIPKITLSEVTQKRLRVLAYLVASGVLGYVLATYVAKDPVLTTVFAPAINFILVTIIEELKKEGYAEAIRQTKEAK